MYIHSNYNTDCRGFTQNKSICVFIKNETKEKKKKKKKKRKKKKKKKKKIMIL